MPTLLFLATLTPLNDFHITVLAMAPEVDINIAQDLVKAYMAHGILNLIAKQYDRIKVVKE